MKKIVSIVLTCSLVFLSACATSPANIIGTNVSPQMYANWDCEQIQSEILRLNSVATNLTAQQAKIYKMNQVSLKTIVMFIFFTTCIYALPSC